MADQTVSSLSRQEWQVSDIRLDADEMATLRSLAGQVADLAARPVEAAKRELWYRHNALQPGRPLVFCDPENGWNEIIGQDSLVCRGALARHWEMILRKEIFWGSVMNDDRVVTGTFDVPYVFSESDWGLHEVYTKEDDLGSYIWDAPLKDYSSDLQRLRFPEIVVDQHATATMVDLAREAVGDFLQVRLRGVWWWTLGMTWTLVRLRGLTQMMMDMVDEPEGLHRIMAFLRDGHMARLDFLQSNGLLSLNNDGTYVGSGGFGWSRELPQQDFGGHVRTSDMWGFGESQETVGVSPAMFEEFVFPYQLPLLERFGLNCYGCCEPLNARWHIVSKVPNLRRVSVSAWADLDRMAEQLGDRYVFSWKPRPADLASAHFDETAVREYISAALKSTRDCRFEIIMKDNHTIGGDPRRVSRWVEIVREEIDRL